MHYIHKYVCGLYIINIMVHGVLHSPSPSPSSSSIGRAGTFSVLSSVLEQLKVEGIVDPFFVVHSLRQQQPGIVSTFVRAL